MITMMCWPDPTFETDKERRAFLSGRMTGVISGYELPLGIDRVGDVAFRMVQRFGCEWLGGKLK